MKHLLATIVLSLSIASLTSASAFADSRSKIVVALDSESSLETKINGTWSVNTPNAVLCYSGRNCTGDYLGLMFFTLCRNSGKSCDLDGRGRCHNF